VKKRPRPSEEATLDAYLREISRFPPLSREEECELAGRIRGQRDEWAFKRLVEANLRVVVSYAQRYRNLGVQFLDLIDEGNLGLMEAARRFDPECHGKFTSYAAWWIRQAIMHALGEQGRVFAAPGDLRWLDAPVATRQRSPRLVDAVLRQEMEELFEGDGTGRAVVRRSAPSAPPVEQAALSEEDGLEFGDVLRGERDAAIADSPVRQAVVDAVREGLHELAPREREVVRLRFGLDERPMTIEEIGDRLQVPRERVRQIEARARGKLRRSHKVRELRSTLN
jgi:RNA polymerase primary sigma factor